MNVFKRMGDIISSNVNSALDKREDPKKMINLMITEMEDTEREIKVSIAEKSAELDSIKRNISSADDTVKRWAERAQMAVDKGNDEMAKEAIIEKRNALETLKVLEANSATIENIIISLKEQLSEVSAKLNEMKAKRNDLLSRANAAKEKIKVNETLREADSIKYAKRFEELQSRIEKWEAEAKVFSTTQPQIKSTRESFEEMERERDIEEELAKLKNNKENN